MKRERLALWGVPLVLIAAGLFWGTALLIPSPSIVIHIGDEEGLNPYAEANHLYSFLGWGSREIAGGKRARRAGPVARFAIPWAFRLGIPLELEFTASSWGVQTPTRLQVNNLMLTLPADVGWRRYRALIPETPTLYEDDLYMQFGTPEATSSQGPLLHEVRLQAHAPERLQRIAASACGLGATVALILLIGRKQPLDSRLIWTGTVSSSAIAGHLLYAPQLLPWEALALLGGAAALLLTRLAPNLRQRLLLWVVLLWILAAPQLLGTWILDNSAFISFRYAKNLIAGAGLTFNPGEPVEGYTNFLWTIALAASMALGFEPVVTAQVLCTGLAVATLLLTYHVAVVWWSGRSWSILPPLILALNPAFLLYTARGSGMETALVTLLALIALWLIWRAREIRSGLLAGLACALVTMARPDGVLVFVAGIAGKLASAWVIGRATEQPLGSRLRSALRPSLGIGMGLALLYLPYFLWRYRYYGYLLPNTFYAKTGATLAQLTRGWNYSADFALALGLPMVALLLGLSLKEIAWPKLQRVEAGDTSGPALIFWLFLLMTVLYVIAVGGDHFPLGRFFIPTLPPVALLITHGLVGVWAWGRQPIRIGAALLFVLFVAWNAGQLPASDSRIANRPIWGEHKVAMKNADMGHWLALHTPPDSVVATGIAGALPYYADRYVIDMLGLNDVHIAHLSVATMGQGVAGAEKMDIPYILERQPDYIPFASAGELLKVERFRREYELIEVYGPKGGKLRLYQRISRRGNE